MFEWWTNQRETVLWQIFDGSLLSDQLQTSGAFFSFFSIQSLRSHFQFPITAKPKPKCEEGASQGETIQFLFSDLSTILHVLAGSVGISTKPE